MSKIPTGLFEPRWPPRSPHEALLSSPSGRSRVRQYHDRTSPSPLPLKKSATTPNLRRIRQALDTRGDEDGDDEEDEETLQLQLQALEAKLKLKRLQQKKSKTAPSISHVDNERDSSSRASSRKENVPPSLLQPRDIHGRGAPRPNTSQGLQIPVSPQRKSAPQAEAHSPGRVLLGIDKGLKGRNISLRRPTTGQSQNDDPFLSMVTSSTYSKASLPRSITTSCLDGMQRPKSFSERIADTRKHDKAREKKSAQLFSKQSSGFGIPQKDIEALKEKADNAESDNNSRVKLKTHAESSDFSREEVLNALNKPERGLVQRSNTISGFRHRGDPSQDIWRNPNAEPDPPIFQRAPSDNHEQRARSHSPRPKSPKEPSRQPTPPTSDFLFEPFSSIHLSKRLLPHDLLTRTFSSKSILLIPSLLGTVKSPDYSLPDSLSADYVVLAIIASKSTPLSHKPKATQRSTTENPSSHTEAATSSQNAQGKYMVLTLTDLKWTLDLYLFTTAYTKFWKLTPGTVIALLNPSVMPPAPSKKDTGRFSLTLNSSDDTVLEIGTARDLGWCKAVRKDGKSCTDWIDKRHTEVCEFHVDLAIEKNRRGRMETQGMSAPFAPGGRKKGRTGFFGGEKTGGGIKSRDGSSHLNDQTDGFTPEGSRYDRGSSSRYFIAPAIPGRSAAELLDAEGMLTRGESKEERMRKRLAERERENEIANRLGEGGNGAGSEYLLLRQNRTKPNTSTAAGSSGLDADAEAAAEAAGRDLLGNKAYAVHLSPIKKRKLGVSEGQSARKKTRFVTEKGIREAGRESLGGKGVGAVVEEEELEIE